MKLLIDIGNTNTSLAIADGGRIKKRYFIYTSKDKVQPTSLKRLLGKNLSKIDSIVIVSVVPAFFSIVKKSIKAIAPKVRVRVIGKDIKVPIKIRYKDPRQVGQDRLVTSFAAAQLFSSPLVIVDFGTAVTFDIVNKKGDYDGGIIFPGLRLALKSLSQEAALLPKIDLKPSRNLVGRDTTSSMNNGILYGYASMCDGLIVRLKEEYGKSVKVVATGGDAELISRYSKDIKTVKPDLIFDGLDLLSG